jgi:hypothetical protein
LVCRSMGSMRLRAFGINAGARKLDDARPFAGACRARKHLARKACRGNCAPPSHHATPARVRVSSSDLRSAARRGPPALGPEGLACCLAPAPARKGMRREMALVTVIVMEPGSAWPGHVAGSENVVEVGQQDGGLLLQRTTTRLDVLRQRGLQVRIALLSCNEATDIPSLTRRSELAHELLAAVASVGFGRLVLTSSEHASIRLRRELLSLASGLSHRLSGTTSTLSVRFGGGDRREIGLADGIGAEVFAHALRVPALATVRPKGPVECALDGCARASR